MSVELPSFHCRKRVENEGATLEESQLYVQSEHDANMEDEETSDTKEPEAVPLPDPKQSATSVNCEELTSDITQADVDDALGVTGVRDVQTLRFQKRIKRSPEQCVRYCLWQNEAVLWAHSKCLPSLVAVPHNATTAADNETATASTENTTTGSRETEPNGVPGIPPCERCGAPRKFEVQLLPQLLFFMDVERRGFMDFDWDTIAVFTCSKSCHLDQNWGREFAWAQTSPKVSTAT